MRNKAQLTWWSAIFIIIIAIAIDVMFSKIAVHVLVSFVASVFAFVLLFQGLLFYIFKSVVVERRIDNLIINFCVGYTIILPLLFLTDIILNRFFRVNLKNIFEYFISYSIYALAVVQMLLFVVLVKNYIFKKR